MCVEVTYNDCVVVLVVELLYAVAVHDVFAVLCVGCQRCRGYVAMMAYVLDAISHDICAHTISSCCVYISSTAHPGETLHKRR
jgi:hypothetical protein